MIGAKVLGSDIAEDMAGGCVANLNHFQAPFERVDVSDIGDIASVFGKVDVVATDPPYGRSASLWKEGKSSLYARAMDAFVDTVRPGGRAGVVFPAPLEHHREELMEIESHIQRVHRSLIQALFHFYKEIVTVRFELPLERWIARGEDGNVRVIGWADDRAVAFTITVEFPSYGRE